MVIFKETSRKYEMYTPLEKYGDRVIDLKTFFEGMRINFHRDLCLAFFDSRKESMIISDVVPSDVDITANGIVIRNRNTCLTISLAFKFLDLSAISEVSNVSNIDYIFPLAKSRRMFYRISVR